MVKFIFMLMFLIPLVFKKKSFWLSQWMMFFMSFMFLLIMNLSMIPVSLSYMFSIDTLSYTMILLSFWICALMILASAKVFIKNINYNLFLFVVLFLLISLLMAFLSMNLFIFYLFFEMSLVPTLVLIIGWGYQPERIQAGLYLLFYTMMASLPMMLFIFYYYSINYSLIFNYLEKNIFSKIMFIFMNMVFLVKMPMYFVHLWLPKAHVEAPVSGSMILAGVMLKLGGYGMMRTLSIFLVLYNSFNYILISISLVGGVIVSLMCLRQSDIKSLIAYSSVSHMGLVLAGLMTMNLWGFYGSLSMMLAHGLCSSGLFCLANIVYERMFSRSLFLVKGLINLMPSMSLMWFLLCSSNMAAPPSFNLLGEIMLINSLVSWSFVTMALIMVMSFFSAVYSLYLYAYSQHGDNYSGVYSFMNGSLREFLLLMLHWLPLNIMILKSELFFSWIYLNSFM
uniref:NADH-ubiquinone oxidoreductase chain 4 n=1 Tax=Staphylinidae sp. BMNH 1274206 TaxID=1796557 RepID=A0A140EGR9_9COLE|nr:NADH dehydrogenase subunit 4 [Staphylinidae sp. BMNH 1274206]